MRRRSWCFIGFALAAVSAVLLFCRNYQDRESAVNDVAVSLGLSTMPEEAIPTSDQTVVQLPDSGGNEGQQSPTADASPVSSLESPATIEPSAVNPNVSSLTGRELQNETVRGQQVAPHVKFYIAAASDEIQQQAEERGYWQALVDAVRGVLPER